MKNRTLRIVLPAFAIVALLLGALVHFQSGANTTTVNAQASGHLNLSPFLKRRLSGFLSSELQMQNSPANGGGRKGNYVPSGDDGCPQSRGNNIKVNRNCLNLSDTYLLGTGVDLQGRGQANNETSVAQDPNNPSHIVASDNDYRRGDGNCYNSFSLDGGQSWTDATVPMGFTYGTHFGGVARQYWQAGGDTSVAWDTKGNAYLDCQVFQRGPGVTNNPDQSSAIYVFRSTHNNGASWNFPGRPVYEAFVTGSSTGLPLEDKPYMTVDNHKGSPFQDRIYVAWTEFAVNSAGNVNAFIYESHSNDYGEHFSQRVLVSTVSTLCPNFIPGDPTNSCDNNQFAQPFTGADGALYITYVNGNNAVTPPDNHNQILLSKSTDGGNSFTSPVKVGDYYDLPDCATYQGGQDAFRACVPEKGSSTRSVFRATNYPSGAVNPLNTKQVVVTYGSYINQFSNEKNGCVPQGTSSTTGLDLYTGVKTPGACNNGILVSVSNDSGSTFTGTTTNPRKMPVVKTSTSQQTTDQFWQWFTFSQFGKFAVSYFDRQYGNDEFNGSSDFSLSGTEDMKTEFPSVRVTSSSMPVPTQFPDAQGNSVFYGDYTGLSAVTDTAYPIWMDTRSPDLALCPGTGTPGSPPKVCTFSSVPNGPMANDQDIYEAAVSIP